MFTYCQKEEVDVYANLHGLTEWAALSSDQKKQIVFISTQIIVNEHNQSAPLGSLWNQGDPELRNACILQALYLGRNYDAFKMSEYANVLSSGSYEDDVLIFDVNGTTKIDDGVQAIIKKKMKRLDIPYGTKMI